MELLMIAAVCTGLWLLFPKSFKFMVGSMVGTMGAMCFWGIALLIWSFIVSTPSWAGMGWSMLAFVIIGNIMGLIIAAKG